jgi:arylsulfatase
MMPTLLEFAGITYDGEVDGISLCPALTGNANPVSDRSFFFVWDRGYPQRYSNMAVRSGNYKLVGQSDHGESIELLKLFDLENDPYELEDVSQVNPEVKSALLKELDQWYEEIIVSPHLLEPPRMIIGSKHENPVILGRNDWKGPAAMHWGSVEAFGYWDVSVENPGPYQVRMLFKDHLPGPGVAKVRVGTRQYGISQADTSQNKITLDNLIFEKGNHAFEGWYQVGAKVYSPICIEIEKKAN